MAGYQAGHEKPSDERALFVPRDGLGVFESTIDVTTCSSKMILLRSGVYMSSLLLEINKDIMETKGPPRSATVNFPRLEDACCRAAHHRASHRREALR